MKRVMVLVLAVAVSSLCAQAATQTLNFRAGYFGDTTDATYAPSQLMFKNGDLPASPGESDNLAKTTAWTDFLFLRWDLSKLPKDVSIVSAKVVLTSTTTIGEEALLRTEPTRTLQLRTVDAINGQWYQNLPSNVTATYLNVQAKTTWTDIYGEPNKAGNCKSSKCSYFEAVGDTGLEATLPVDLVSSWRDSPETNSGMRISNYQLGSENKISFYLERASTPEYRPTLELVVHAPEPTTAGLLLAGAVALATRRRRA